MRPEVSSTILKPLLNQKSSTVPPGEVEPVDESHGTLRRFLARSVIGPRERLQPLAETSDSSTGSTSSADACAFGKADWVFRCRQQKGDPLVSRQSCTDSDLFVRRLAGALQVRV